MDIYELLIDEIEAETRRSRNTWRLVEWLRQPPGPFNPEKLHPKLRRLCADILSGKIKASYREPPEYRLSASHVRSHLTQIERRLAEGDAVIIQIARDRGINGAEDGRSRSRVAKEVFASLLGKKPRYVDELLWPRAGRGKHIRFPRKKGTRKTG